MRALALVGPTASGKTALSLPVARRLDGEVISMDSRQVYRGMDIGTAKVDRRGRELVPHHGLDLVEPNERYSAGRFAREARRWMDDIEARGRVPILVGGTGFFLRTLTTPIFREPRVEEARRDRLRKWLSRLSFEDMVRWAAALDPERAELAEAGGAQRLTRTLEVPLLTGRSLTWWHREAPPEGEPLDIGTTLLTLPRGELYRRIDERVRAMFREGLLEEVRGLLDAGFTSEDPGMTATGYREAVRVLRGEETLEDAVGRMQSQTRGYARRQLTWFRNQLEGPVIEVDALAPLEDQVGRVVDWWRGIGAAAGG